MASHRSLPQGTDSVVNRELKCLVDNTSDFYCCSQASGVISKHPLPKLRSWRFTPVFSSKNVRVLALTPGPLVHPGCIFVHAVSQNPALLFCTWYPVVPASVVDTWLFPLYGLRTLVKLCGPQRQGMFLGCQFQSMDTPVYPVSGPHCLDFGCFAVSLKWRNVGSPALFLSFNIVFGCLGPLPMPYKV